MSALSQPQFNDEEKAFRYLESIRWADGIVCPHCGRANGRVYSLGGKSTRVGLKKCGECRRQFTVKVGTVFEHARLPLHKMLYAAHLMTRAGGGASARELHRALGITYKSARFLAQRIRAAMESGELAAIGGEPAIGSGDKSDKGEAARLQARVRAASPTRDLPRGTNPRQVSRRP